MSTPGWYPDPSGQPNSFRYWNGQVWSHETSPTPYAAPPGSTPPPPPSPQPPTQPPTQPPVTQPPVTQPLPVQPPPNQPPPVQPPPVQPPPGWTPGGPPPPPPSAPRSGGAGKKVVLVLLAVVLVAGVAVGSFFGVRALTDDSDDSSATDDTSASASPSASESVDESETPLPTESPSASATIESPPLPTAGPATPVPAACTAGAPLGGRAPGAVLRGGGLQAPAPDGFTPMGLDPLFTFADRVVTVARQMEPQWLAVYALGGLPTSTGYTSLEQAAESVLTCMTGSEVFYKGFSGRVDQGSSAISVGGHEAWRITAEVRVDNPEIKAEGDVVTVVVVDTGAPGSYGLFVSLVPIGDADLIGQQEQVVGALQVR